MTTGQNIRALRKKRGLTQEKLGALCGMTAGAISSYENGVTVPKHRVVERIARALEVPAGKIEDSAPLEVSASHAAERKASDLLLYDGVLAALKELYGIVEGKVIVGENGAQRKYYVVRQISGDFILREDDIAAIVQSAKASISPVAAYLRRTRERAAG